MIYDTGGVFETIDVTTGSVSVSEAVVTIAHSNFANNEDSEGSYASFIP